MTAEQLKDLLAKVTPGEWEFFDDNGYDRSGVEIPHESCNDGAATLIALAPTLAAEVVRLREALEDIASQKKSNEFVCIRDYRNADFEGGYDECVSRARQALDATSEK